MHTHINIGCMFRLYYFCRRDTSQYNTSAFFEFGFFFLKNLVDTKRKCLSVFLLTIYCPLAAESSLSTFLTHFFTFYIFQIQSYRLILRLRRQNTPNQQQKEFSQVTHLSLLLFFLPFLSFTPWYMKSLSDLEPQIPASSLGKIRQGKCQGSLRCHPISMSHRWPMGHSSWPAELSRGHVSEDTHCWQRGDFFFWDTDTCLRGAGPSPRARSGTAVTLQGALGHVLNFCSAPCPEVKHWLDPHLWPLDLNLPSPLQLQTARCCL